jgi:hypothetical protein
VSEGLVPFISLKFDGLLTRESRPCRISAGRRGRIFALDSTDWSNGLRYHNFDTRTYSEFNARNCDTQIGARRNFRVNVDADARTRFDHLTSTEWLMAMTLPSGALCRASPTVGSPTRAIKTSTWSDGAA